MKTPSKRDLFHLMIPLLAFGPLAKAQDPYPAAILSFAERGEGAKGQGEKVSDLLFAELVADPDLLLVDRSDLKKLLEEIELNLSGNVQAAQAIKVGNLTGAKILVSGSIIEAGSSMYIVAKIISTETSRVLGESVKGKAEDELGPLVESLAVKIKQTIVKRGGELVAKTPKKHDRIAAIKKALGDKKLPSVSIRITERHLGAAAIDPAAETEISFLCKETGFELFETKNSKKTDVRIVGEAFSEFGARRGNLVSVKARVEVKAIDNRTDKVLAVDRQTVMKVDLTEQIAGKAALQEAAARISERLLPKLIK